MKIDLGCGPNKHDGYFGIDKRRIADVDLVWDINESIPLPSDSVEFVMASRSLPYVNDLFKVMADLYRLCSHKAVVCILAPYAHHFDHMANPYIKQRFDESSPRYWTPSFYEPSHGFKCPELSPYADSSPPFDFRLLHMELLYDSEFDLSLYDSEELGTIQRFQPNAAVEIVYYVAAVKKVIAEEELDELSRGVYPRPNVLEQKKNAEY
ncbi:hypothetical protein ACFQZE_09960 [Paenibacillus sp. GCM10027627]|uniref:hypothetical protein n=1 Tax=unclassified Paenibacillus TaxID=185978 RepID=UPI0036372F28